MAGADVVIEIAEANIEQIEEIVSINCQIFSLMYQEEPFALEYYKEKLKGKNPVIYMAKVNSVIVGDSVSFERDGSLYIWVLGVKKEYRNKGIATSFLELNEQLAKKNGYKSVTIKVYNVSKEMLKLVIDRGYNIQSVEISKISPKYNGVRLELTLN